MNFCVDCRHYRSNPVEVTTSHKAEMAARKARRAARVSSGYDHSTGRSVVRAVHRALAGLWDGKPKKFGGVPNWAKMKP